jgi:hypothetical protein
MTTTLLVVVVVVWGLPAAKKIGVGVLNDDDDEDGIFAHGWKKAGRGSRDTFIDALTFTGRA